MLVLRYDTITFINPLLGKFAFTTARFSQVENKSRYINRIGQIYNRIETQTFKTSTHILYRVRCREEIHSYIGM